MSKRNFILLIIVLVIATVIGFFVISSYKQKGSTDTSTGTNFFSDFFPFGKSTPITPGTETPADISGTATTNTETPTNSNLKKITDMKVAGYVIFQKERFVDVPTVTPPAPTPSTDTTNPTPKTTDTKTNKKTAIKPTAPLTEFAPSLRYVDKSTGNVYQTFADKIYEQKITTNIVPQVHEAYFGNNGQSVVMRYLNQSNTIESFVGLLPKEILGADMFEGNQMNASFLPENVTDLSFSSDTTKLFYMFNSKNNSFGITSDYLGTRRTQVFTSPFTEWLSAWPNNNLINLTTKPSSSVPGYMYGINPSKKDFNKILGNIKGLTTLTSPSGKLVLYADNGLNLRIYNIDSRESVDVGAKTMPEKCTWNSTSTNIYCAVPKFTDGDNYPDTWYQGETSFEDEIWRIDPQTGNGSTLVDISATSKEDTDAIKLSVDVNENYLFFINKNTNYLWELNLKQ